MTLIFLGEHCFVEEHIACIKDAGDGRTAVWVVGQPATDGGFLVDMPYGEVIDLITGGEDAAAEGEEKSAQELS
jgi:hypothetical protein